MEVANLKDKILNFILNSGFFWAYKGNNKIKNILQHQLHIHTYKKKTRFLNDGLHFYKGEYFICYLFQNGYFNFYTI